MTPSIQDPPAFIFQIALLTLLSLDQADLVPTPTERPRQISDGISNVTYKGHAPWLQRLHALVKEGAAEGTHPLPLITPPLLPEGATMAWTSSGNAMSIRHNTRMSGGITLLV